MPTVHNLKVPQEFPGELSHVVVKFAENLELPYEKGAEQHFERWQIGAWKLLQERFPGISLQPMITAVSVERLQALEKEAVARDDSYRPANFQRYFIVDAPPDTDLIALAETLQQWRWVQTAYVDRHAPDPAVMAADDPRQAFQGYLDAAPDGIDAEYAWGFSGGDGAGQRVIDLERGWTFNHEDLAAHSISLLHGTLLDSSRSHGTSVLGELCAVDNTLGCVGIAPNLADVQVVSFHGSTRPNAIFAAIDNMVFGDVLLLEAQVWLTATSNMLGPIEIYDAEYDAIRLATALGIIVVEAGGNGTNNGSAPALDMDTYTNSAGLAILNRHPANPDFRDSGAIIVTAASSAAPHTRLAYGPFGRRIDCFAWGQNVNTLRSDDTGTTNLYTTTFSGTSSASPIVAGAALLVQGIAEASLGYRFSPRQMRDILSNTLFNTPPAATETTLIGRMPNLRGIIDSVLGLVPDVYIRDNVGDTGEAHSGSISASPDIILRPMPVANPQAAYGAGSGTENNAALGAAVEDGQDNYIYVRVLNQGGAAAVNVQATVYWSPVATLVTPDLWTEIGTVTLPNVPMGEVLTVSDALLWPAADIPGPGHYCLVGIVGTAGDPAPGPADFLDWDNFRRFIRENNNVTWRNFNVVNNEPDDDPGVPAGFKALAFLAPGAPDRARVMELEVLSRMPQGARLLLEVPLHFLDLLQERSPYVKIDKQQRLAYVPLNPHTRNRFMPICFPAKSRTALRLLVALPRAARQHSYQIAVRQLYEREEVGRVTWQLVPEDPCKDKDRREVPQQVQQFHHQPDC